MVVDNGCDQSIINVNSFLIKSFAGELFNVGGALHSMRSSQLELVSDAFTLITLPDNTHVIFKLNQCFLDRDPSQTEALLQPHQARAFGVIVDDCASCHQGIDGDRGGQQLRIDDVSYPMHFDGGNVTIAFQNRQRRIYSTIQSLKSHPHVRMNHSNADIPVVLHPQLVALYRNGVVGWDIQHWTLWRRPSKTVRI